MIEEKISMKIYKRNESLLANLKKKKLGNMLSCTKKHILDLSNYRIIRCGKFCSIAWSELLPSTKINMQRTSLCRI